VSTILLFRIQLAKPQLPMADVTVAEAALAAVPGGAQASSSTQSVNVASETGVSAKETKGGKAEQAKKEATSAPTQELGPPPAELSKEQLAKMSKEERTAYHQARRQAAPKADAKQQLTKAERAKKMEEERKIKEDSKAAAGAGQKEREELLKELKDQGLSVDQARDLMNEMLKDREQADDGVGDVEEDEAEDYFSCVKSWMAANDQELPDNPVSDFNLKVRFQGHNDTTPPDHIAAILHVITEQGCCACGLDAKTQPAAVAKKLEPAMTKWATVLKAFWKKIDDTLTGLDAIMRGIQEGTAALVSVPESGRACGVVGCLMALRDTDMIEDEDLLTACRRAESRPKVMERFIEFLEAELEDEDEDED